MYAKLFASLYQGTLRGCSDSILVFTNLLAHCDASGVVDQHWRAIAEETGLSRERVEAAIAHLEAPDPESRSPEEEGRRIMRLDEHRAWGWRVVNHGKYRAIRNEDERREQNRQAQQRWRDKQNKPRKPESAQADTEAEADTHTDKTHSLSITEGGAACLAMRKHIPTVNPSDPRLKALIQAGATPEEFEYAAQKAVGKANAFAYALKIVESRRQEAASIAANPGKTPTKPVTEKQARIAEFLGSRAPGAKKERIING